MNINSALFLQLVVFFIGALITMKYIWPPLVRSLDERRKKIADGLKAAEAGTRSLSDAQRKIQQLEADARARAQAIVAETEKRAQALVDEAKAQAKVEGDRLVAAARQEAEQEMQRAKTTLRDQVALLAVAGAEQILRREVNPQVHADLLAQLKGRL
jgi:F-type H+-transporting ATPase subunit b